MRYCVFFASLGSPLFLSRVHFFWSNAEKPVLHLLRWAGAVGWTASCKCTFYTHTHRPAAAFFISSITLHPFLASVCVSGCESECISWRPGPLTAVAAGQRDTGELHAIKSLPPRIKSSLVAPPPISHFINMYLNLIGLVHNSSV